MSADVNVIKFKIHGGENNEPKKVTKDIQRKEENLESGVCRNQYEKVFQEKC